ncbi:MAG TPA: inorganic diphosphatase, partial [Solirubrobacteraceae bacterium]|nr:inorganic diphosphatase [Solirubrobacteraceae bacterium]
MIRIDKIPPRTDVGTVNVLVEVPKGGHTKFEYDEDLGVMRLSRVLHSAVYFPTDYGFVPGAVGEDGEHLDALVLVDAPGYPGVLVETRVLGALKVEKGDVPVEHRLLCTPVAEPRFADYEDLRDIPRHTLAEIEHFFDIFRDLEAAHHATLGWIPAGEATDLLDRAIAAAGAA